MSRNKRHLYTSIARIIFITAIGFLGFMLLDSRELELTSQLSQWKNSYFAQFMERSIFEGNAFGGSDIASLFQIIVAFLFVISLRARSFFARWRDELGFMAISSFAVGVGLGQGLKWSWGRARPYMVLKDLSDILYTRWFEPGMLNISHGKFAGSFPSGHVANMVLMLVISYTLSGNRTHRMRMRTRLIGIALGVFTVMSSISMAVARTMTLKHWPTDSWASIFLCWCCIHYFYFHVFSLDQKDCRNSINTHAAASFNRGKEIPIIMRSIYIFVIPAFVVTLLRGWFNV